MLRALLSRLLSSGMIVLIAAGGGALPTLDGVLFHSPDRAAADLQSHYEATGGCHSDWCAIHATAYQAKISPSVDPVGQVVAVPECRISPPSPPALCTNPLAGQPLSRAPPRFA